MSTNGFTSDLWDLIKRPSRKIQIPYDNTSLVDMTAEGVQAPHEHFGFYDAPAIYTPEPPAYHETQQQAWFEEMQVTSSSQPVMHDQPIAQPEPQQVAYEDCPMTQDLLDLIVQDWIGMTHEPLDDLTIQEENQVNEAIEDIGIEGMFREPGIEQFEMEQQMFDEQMQMMDPFGPMM